jgi:hypothetical protein
MPESWRSDFADNSSILASVMKRSAWLERTTTTDIGEADSCDGNYWVQSGGVYLKWNQVTEEETVCEIMSGDIDLPPLHRSDVYRALIIGAPDTECPGGPEQRWEITVLNTDVPTVTFPLSDP